MARHAAGARLWWARPGYARATVPDDLGVVLPEQAPSTAPSYLPMRRLAAALLVDAIKCLAYPREHRSYRDALRYLLGPPRDEVLPCDIACQLAGITHEHLCRVLRAAGHSHLRLSRRRGLAVVAGGERSSCRRRSLEGGSTRCVRS